jgi:integrase
MAVYKRGTYYHYAFEFKGQRYRGTTKQRTLKDANTAEALIRRQVEQEAAGIAIPRAEHSPRFQDWADVYYAHASTKMGRPERVDILLRIVLRFWGARPRDRKYWPRPEEAAPFHDLRLADAVNDPEWIERFEQWMVDRGIAGQTKNQYRSVVSQMYHLARKPAYRKRTGITSNPFDGIDRDKGGRSTFALTVEQAQATLAAASYHVRLAIGIAALAPKLRRSNILGLRWGVHIDKALNYITVEQHKTAEKTKRPLVIPITAQLRTILLDAKARNPRAVHVVTYRGQPVKDVRGGLKAAMIQAGVPYGRYTGATFHSLRHAAATWMAELDISPEKRQKAMGHEDMATTNRYTHLRPTVEAPVLEQLSAALPIADLITRPGRRASRKGTVVDFVVGKKSRPAQTLGNTGKRGETSHSQKAQASR